MPPLADVIAACREAGDAALALRGAVAQMKHDGSPVTLADRASHEVLMERLGAYGWPIVSEESLGNIPEHARGPAWIVDPLDGTSAFVADQPEWSVMVGLVENGVPVMGVVYAPRMHALWSAVRGEGAFVERDALRTKLSVSSVSDTSQATIFLSLHHPSPESDLLAQHLGARPVRRAGLGLKACFIAERAADLYWTQANVGEWDVCAPQLILEEAGGRITDARGESLRYGSLEERAVRGVAASNGVLHDALTAAGRFALMQG